MGNKLLRFSTCLFGRNLLGFAPLGLSLCGLLLCEPNFAEVDNSSGFENRDIYNSFDSEDKVNEGIPSTPMDLLEKLRRIGAMDDATNPSDAIDDALKFFNLEVYENVPEE